MISAHSRRKNSYTPHEHSQHTHNKNDYLQPTFSPHKAYRPDYVPTSENFTPRKKSINLREKENHQENYHPIPSSHRQYDNFSQSPLKQSMNLYDMQAKQQMRGRQAYEPRYTPSSDRQNLSKGNFEAQRNEDYKPRNYCYDVKENISKRPESGAKKLGERHNYLGREENKPEIPKITEIHSQRKKDMYSNENVLTPRKQERNHNNLIEKSEKVKQKIQKLNRMTPRQTFVRNDFQEQQWNYVNEGRVIEYPKTEERYTKRTVPEMAERTERHERHEIHEKYDKYEKYEKYEKQERAKEESEKNMQNIAFLSQKISERLRAIIDKHGN